jgi:GDP-L-fucose synthase
VTASSRVFALRSADGNIITGTGEDLTIAELASMVRDVVHPVATIRFDPSKPDGMPRKQLNVDRLHALGWRHRITLADGIRTTYAWFLDNREALRATGRVEIEA